MGYFYKFLMKDSMEPHNLILSQVYSPCGDYLIVGDNRGLVSVYSLEKLLNCNKTPQNVLNRFEVNPKLIITSMISTLDNLVIANYNFIEGYRWEDVISNNSAKPVWKIEMPVELHNVEDKVDVNCMSYHKWYDVLYVGGSDYVVDIIYLRTGKIVNAFKKQHKKAILSIANLEDNVVSGSEDGCINKWDLRTGQLIAHIEPFKNSKIARNNLGKWISAVDLKNSWMLCGGGPKLSIWDYRNCNACKCYNLDDKGVYVAKFYKNTILSGGRTKKFYQLAGSGEVLANIPTTSETIFSAVYRDEPFRVLSLSGSSFHIDISTNFKDVKRVVSLS